MPRYRYLDNPEANFFFLVGAVLLGGGLIWWGLNNMRNELKKQLETALKQEAEEVSRKLGGQVQKVFKDNFGWVAEIWDGVKTIWVRLKTAYAATLGCSGIDIPGELQKWSQGDGQAVWLGLANGNLSRDEVWSNFRQYMVNKKTCDPGPVPLVEFYQIAKNYGG